MNAERLHAIARAVRGDLASTQAPTLVQELAVALQNQVQNPAEPAYQKEVSELRTRIDSALAAAPSNTFSPAWEDALVELGIADLPGNRLRHRIDAIFQRHQITLASAAEEIAAIAERLGSLNSALDQLLAGLEWFAIGVEELEPGEFEVGVLIPRRACAANSSLWVRSSSTLSGSCCPLLN